MMPMQTAAHLAGSFRRMTNRFHRRVLDTYAEAIDSASALRFFGTA
jgi:hypothetical protein